MNNISDRRKRSSKGYRCDKRMIEIAKSNSSERFTGCNDPLESVLFSAALEIQKIYPSGERHLKLWIKPF